jgi:hypothetical protein
VNRCDSSWIGGGNPQLTTSFALLELVGNFSRCFRTLLVYFGHSMVSGWVPMLIWAGLESTWARATLKTMSKTKELWPWRCCALHVFPADVRRKLLPLVSVSPIFPFFNDFANMLNGRQKALQPSKVQRIKFMWMVVWR